jgi:hypothetical protein
VSIADTSPRPVCESVLVTKWGDRPWAAKGWPSRSVPVLAVSVVAGLLLAACSTSPDANPAANTGATPAPTAVPADGLVGLPIRRLACPDPVHFVRGWHYNNIKNYEPVTGTVTEYLFCRHDWYSDRPPDRHLDMTKSQLIADVTDALSAPDQTATPGVDCPDGAAGAESALPIVVETTEGRWLLKAPSAPCGTVLDELAAQLATLDPVT